MTTSTGTKKKTTWQRIKSMGPGAIVTAAVVGPGTVTTCGLSGYGFGYALAWALSFSVIAMVIMQFILRPSVKVRSHSLLCTPVA